MNKNMIIAGLVAVVVLVLGYAAFKSAPSDLSMDGQNATSTNNLGTTTNNTNNNQNNPPVTRAVTAPLVQTNSEASISNSTALVSGQITPNGAQTSYWYDYGTTQALSNQSAKQNIGAGYTPITAPMNIVGLQQKTQYFFRLNAQNSVGITRGEIRTFTTNTSPIVSGKAPTTETINPTGVARNGAVLMGKVTSNNNQATYWFEYGEKTSLGNVTTFGYVGPSQISTPVTSSVAGLKPLTKYYYRINAQNQFGTVNGSIVSFTTTGPADPSAPVIKTNAATSIATSSVTMNGRLDPKGADTTYWFEYSKYSFTNRSADVTITATQSMGGAEAAIGVKADVTGLERNTRYYYRMIARNAQGTIVGEVVSFRTR